MAWPEANALLLFACGPILYRRLAEAPAAAAAAALAKAEATDW